MRIAPGTDRRPGFFMKGRKRRVLGFSLYIPVFRPAAPVFPVLGVALSLGVSMARPVFSCFPGFEKILRRAQLQTASENFFAARNAGSRGRTAARFGETKPTEENAVVSMLPP